MSFDLYVFPPSGPATVDQVHALMEAEEQRISNEPGLPDLPPGPQTAKFLAELERRWPGLDAEDPDTSPWSS